MLARRVLVASLGFVCACGGGGSDHHPDVDAAPPEKQVDILFLVDDSPGMATKQQELRDGIPALLSALDGFAAQGHPADYHIGVVTSDLGGGASTATCPVGGLGGKLQALGRAHDASCVPPGNSESFIDVDQHAGTSNLPTGQDLATTLDCMAEVGTAGCGFEHSLEAVYQALDGCLPAADGSYPNCTISENRGFLRPDSLLVIVWVTDEDDCSADPGTNLFDLNQTLTYGSLTSYRCSNYGVACNGSLLPYGDSGGALSGCTAAPNPNGAGPGKLFDVSRYITFFEGLRADPSELLLAAIDGPVTPVQVVVGNSTDFEPAQPGGYGPCPQGSTVGQNGCNVLLGHSCMPSIDRVADPAVRIDQVLNAVSASNAEASACDADYTPALTALATRIGAQL